MSLTTAKSQRGRGFKPHHCHCVVSLSKNIIPSLAMVQPRKTRPFITERLLKVLKESNLTKTGLDLLQSSGEYPCVVCRTVVGSNNIYCYGCKLWVHKKCSWLQRLTPNPDYRCARCIGNTRPIDGRPEGAVVVARGGSFLLLPG